MGNIITWDDLEVEGIIDPAYDRIRGEVLISQAEQALETITGRLFRKVDDQIQYANGRRSALLRLKHPAIELTSVSIDDEEVDATTYEIVSELTGEDHLFNPKLRLIDGSVWPKGERNVELIGSFGFVIPDGDGYTAPPLIKRVVMLIVARWLTQIVEKIGAENQSRITSERLGAYSYTLSDQAVGSGMFGDPEIDEIIGGYKRLGMGAV